MIQFDQATCGDLRATCARKRLETNGIRGFASSTVAGLGHVSEIFDADSPHTPRGCIAQAWSVAELLRAAVEDVFCIKPSRRELAIGK